MSSDRDDELTDRMSDLEALMWSLESDPMLSSAFANLTFLDRAPDPDLLWRRMWRATRSISRLRRRVVDSFGPGAPAWEEDPAFDLDHHLRWLELPKGATEADVRALAVDATARPFARDRPLWEFTVVTGLPAGRAAMIQKLHHTITDGEGGIRMSLAFIDLERHPSEPDPIDDPPPPPPTDRAPWSGAVEAVTNLARRNAEGARRLVGSATEWAKDPAHIASLLASLPSETAATTRSVVNQLAVVDRFRSPVWTERSLDRALETFQVPLDEVKDAAHRLGGSVNDLFVAAAAGGAGTYHRRLGADVDELRMSMPVSTRADRAPTGNAFTPTRVLVPLSADPIERFTEIHERLGVTKSDGARGITTAFAGLANLLPQQVLVRLGRQQVLTVDFTTSNVRAAPFDLYIAGARMTANYPLGPLVGTAWNLTTMSYRGKLDIGLHVDLAAVPDPAVLRADIEGAFVELLEAQRPKRRRRPKASG